MKMKLPNALNPKKCFAPVSHRLIAVYIQKPIATQQNQCRNNLTLLIKKTSSETAANITKPQINDKMTLKHQTCRSRNDALSTKTPTKLD